MAEEVTSGLQKLRVARAAREHSGYPSLSSGNVHVCGRGTARQGTSSSGCSAQPPSFLTSTNSTLLSGGPTASDVHWSEDKNSPKAAEAGCIKPPTGNEGAAVVASKPENSSDSRAVPSPLSSQKKRTETELLLNNIFDRDGLGEELSKGPLPNEDWSPLPLFLQPLRDSESIRSYVKLFSAHKSEICGKVVLDVGCKAGLLSILCAGLGARTVFAMDSSPFSALSVATAFDSGYQNVVPVRAAPETCTDFPKDISRVDVIVSDWLGIGFFRSNLLLQVVTARDKYMKVPKIFPRHARLFVCGISSDTHHTQRYWKQASSIDFSLLRSLDLTSPIYGDIAEAESICTTTCPLRTFNLETLKAKEIGFTEEFCLTIPVKVGLQHIPLTGLAVYFELFDGANPSSVILTTDPRSGKITRYGQTIFCFPNPPIINSKSEISGRFTYYPDLAGGTDPSFVLEYAVDNHPPLVEYYGTDLSAILEDRRSSRGA